MFKKIMEKIKARKNQQTEEKICWPCDWNYKQVMDFNAMLMGMSLGKTQP